MARYRSTYTVCGTGRFPVDMLRYDTSYPATEAGSSEIARGYDGGSLREPREIALVHMGEVKDWKPTEGRWGSFGWRVKPDALRTEKR